MWHGKSDTYGFNSLLRVVFIISIDAGEVLDFQVKCKHCFKCRVCSKWDEDSDKCKGGRVNENECSINHGNLLIITEDVARNWGKREKLNLLIKENICHCVKSV